jgi:hypothetical protein
VTSEVYHTIEHAQSNPYAFMVVPPVGRLLECICTYLSVGGCFRPGNRKLADSLGYASASQIPYLLSQLACDGWVSYDSASGVIMLLRDPRDPASDQPIRSPDRSAEEITGDDFAGDSAVIDPIDRGIPQQDAEHETDQASRSNPQRMEDHVLVTAADHDSESAVARYKIPCAADSISPPDHPAALVLSELGTVPKLIAKALAKRPDLTPEQVRATWAHFEPRIKAELCTAGAFHAAISNGQLHAAPPNPDRPLEPNDYAHKPGFALGSDLPPPDEPESIRDHAARLLPPPTADTLREHTRDWMFLQGRLGAGDTDQEARAALDAYRAAVRR